MFTGSKEQQGASRGFGVYVVKLAALAMERYEAALRPLDLNPLAYQCLIWIAEDGGLSQKDLSTKLNMYAPKMVGLLDGLEKRELVERQVSPNDRRRHSLSLTPKGRALLDQALAVAAKLEHALFGDLPEADKARLIALVERLKGGDCEAEAK